MNSKVFIAPNSTGALVSPFPENTNIYQVIIKQYRSLFNNKGAIQRQLLESLILGDKEDLERLISEGLELDGIIVIRDSVVSYLPDPMKNVRTDSTGVILKYNNSPIYRNYIYSTNNTAKDEIIEPNNTDEIRSAQGRTSIT
jgi:hypothetical protein